MNKPNALNTRSLVALVMLFSFVWLPIAGIALHFSDTASFQPTRHLLMTIHDLAAAIFLISALVHIKLNWKAIANYLRITVAKGKDYRREMGIAALSVTAVLALGILHVFLLGGR